MNEIIYALVIFSLLGYVIYLNRQHQKETQLLLNRIMAKDLNEFKQTTVPVKTDKTEKLPPQYADMQAMPDEEWDKIIKQQAGTESPTSKAIKSLKSKIRK
jgi:hypothetical protein